MQAFKNINSRIYIKISSTYLKILIYILFAMFFLLIIFSNSLYYNFEKVGLQLINQYNEKFLHQLTYNINYMNEMTKNFCITQYMDPDNVHLMYSDKDDTYYIQRNLNRFQKTLDSQSMYHSAVLYNNKTGQFYSTYRGVFDSDEQLIELLDNQIVSTLTPIPRVLPKEIYFDDVKVFTYVMYDQINDYGQPDAALIVNIKTDWLFENIKKLNNNDINYIIINKEGKVIADGSGKLPIFQQLERGYLHQIQQDSQSKNTIITEINDEKYVASYFPIENTDWLLISEQPYSVVFNKINVIRNKTIVLTIIFLVLSVLISIFVAKNIYMPFGKLVKQVKETLVDYFPQNDKNDTEYLAKVFQLEQSRLKDYEIYRKSTEDIINENFIKAMLIENNFINTEHFKENFNKYRDLFGKDTTNMIIILKIDKYKDFIKKDKEERRKIKAIIFNMIKQKMSELCSSQTVFMGNGEFVVIMDISKINNNNLLHEVHRKLREIQIDSVKSISVTLSAFIGDVVKDTQRMNKYYKELQKICRYRLIYGSCSIIDQSIVSRHIQDKNNKYPIEIQQKILNLLKVGHLEEIKEEYEKFIISISEREMDYFILALMRLSLAIQSFIQQGNINSIDININDFNSNLMYMETLEQINKAFFDLFENIVNEQKLKKEQKYDVLINSIMDYISLEYDDKDLSLKKVASEFKMSSVYLGKIYREATNRSVSDYINEVRLSKVIQLLENTEYNVRQIMDRVGYDNESNFYKIFKKKFGMTPKHYRMAAVLNQNNVEKL